MDTVCKVGQEWNDAGKCDGIPADQCAQKTIGYLDCKRCISKFDIDGDKVKDEECIKCPKGMAIMRGECVPKSRI
jgi:hypothetical protein